MLINAQILIITFLGDESESENSKSSIPEQPERNIAVKRANPVAVQPQKNKRDMTSINSTNFLDDFNPLNSQRERNKQKNQFSFTQVTKKTAKKVAGALYDENGKLKSTGQDVCDCFNLSCPGCHMECEWCSSNKCGLRCRNNRKFMYDAIEFDGKDKVITNPFLSKHL